MKFRRPDRTEEGLNITPLIDVVFLLLIFFMVSTSFTRETELNIVLPEADTELHDQDADAIEVLVDREGRYAVNGRVLVDTQKHTLQRALREANRAKPDAPLIVAADGRTPHQAVVTVMEAAGEAGLNQMTIAAQRPAEPSTVR